MLFANSSSYTELVSIVCLLHRNANWQEKKGLFLASFPHLHSRRQSCFKPSNYLQFVTVMTIVKDKTKKSFWTGLTIKEGCFCKRDCTQTYESPMGVQGVLTSLILLPQGSAFLLGELMQSLNCVLVRCLHPPQAALWGLLFLMATRLTSHHYHNDGASDPSQLLFLPTTALLHLSECGLLSHSAQEGQPCGGCHLGRNPLTRDIGGDGVKVIPAILLCASQGC